MHDTNTEIELKLALVKGSLARARRAIGDVHFDETAIEDIYFDTPDATLRRRGLVLRLRRDGDRWLQTLKAAHNGHGVVPVRGEWEVALPASTSAPALDLERFEITPLRVLLRSGLQADSLVPVFRTRISRQRGTLVHGSSEIEVALDQGELRARVEGRKRRQPVAEVELELKSGRPHDLLAVGSELVAQCRRTTLVPALRSKAERGYGLAARDGMGAVRASAGGFAERIRPDMPAAEALREVIRHGLALVVANADALRADPASEHVHQSRVALRRMRSAIRWFDPRGADFPPRLGRQLRWLARHARSGARLGRRGRADPAGHPVGRGPGRRRRACVAPIRKPGAGAVDQAGRRGGQFAPLCAAGAADRRLVDGRWQRRRRTASAKPPPRCSSRPPAGCSGMHARSAG